MLAGGATHFYDERPFFTVDDKTKYMRSDFRISRGSEDDWSSVYTTLTDITQYRNSEENENIEVFMNQLRNFFDKNPDEMAILNLGLRKELQQKIINENELINEQVGLKYTLSRRVQFMRALVHELKSYITPLIAAVELLDVQCERDGYHELRNTIKSTTEGLNNRIDEILDLAKGEIGLLSLKRKWVDMNEVLGEIGSSTRIEAVRRHRIFKLDLENNLPTMWVDEDRIIQMVLNLIHNAIRYTPESEKLACQHGLKKMSYISK
jgi:signal transduction histidine kinase